ncbi:MAG: UDP-2,3-diacylglucosamine diphosphatase [Pseudobdellovibrio sp.]
MKHWFLSDIHLKDINERNGNILLRFLFYLNENPKNNTLYFLGDIFDFWLSDGKAFQNHYALLVDEIKKFKSAGGTVFYFEGNHDFHVDRFWTKQLDIPVYEDQAYFEIDGLKVRCEHGDYINPDDKAYIKYRETIRKPWIEWIGHVVPGFFWKWFGERQSAKSRKKTGHYAKNNVEGLRTMIQAYAMRLYSGEDFDLLITGHMHVFDDYSFKGRHGKTIRSINLGTWLDKPYLLKIENGQVAIENALDLVEMNLSNKV